MPRVCWFGIYREDYPRNYILLDGLEELGVTVIRCGVGPYERFRYLKLVRKLLALRGQYDVVYAAFPAQSVVPIAKLLTRKPVVMDAFYSMFDSIVRDRGELPWYHPHSLKALFLDWVSVLLADLVIADTEAHASYWASWWGVSREKIGVVYIGSDTKYFYPITVAPHDGFLVQYHGSYIPLQGLDVVIRAVELLRDEQGISFRFIGSGQEYAGVRAYVEDKELQNIEFIERLPFEEINRYLNEADIVLGIFGKTQKADRVIPNKLFEGIAVGKPVITKDGAVVREGFSDTELILVPRDPERIASAIRMLRDDTSARDRYARAGHERFLRSFTEKSIARSLLGHFAAICS